MSINQKEIRAVVDAYTGKPPASPLDPEIMAVAAAAMRPPDNATPEERQRFENMRQIVTGQHDAEQAAVVDPVVKAYTGQR